MPVWWNGRHARLKSGCPVGRAGSSPATGTRGRQKRLNMGARWCVLWPTLGRVALWLVPPVGRWCPTFGGWCAGSCCASCVRFVFAVLFPSFWTVIPRGRWVRLLSGSLTLCGWGSIPLLSAGVHAPACWGFPRLCSGGRGVGFSLFLVWTVFAWLSRRVGGCSLWGYSGISRLSTVWPLPVLLRAGRERAIPLFGDGAVSVRGGAGA